MDVRSFFVTGFEGEAVQSGLPVDVRDRGRPSAQFARESNPVISIKRKHPKAGAFFLSPKVEPVRESECRFTHLA